MYASKIAPRAVHLDQAVKAVREGRYQDCLNGLMNATDRELRKLYQEREIEPEMAGEDWLPGDAKYL